MKTVGRGGQRKECGESVFKPKLTGKLFNTAANFRTVPLDMIHTYRANESSSVCTGFRTNSSKSQVEKH